MHSIAGMKHTPVANAEYHSDDFHIKIFLNHFMEFGIAFKYFNLHICCLYG